MSDADSSVYCIKGDLHTILDIYLDNGLIASTQPAYINDILLYLKSNFKVVYGGMEYFINYQIERDSNIDSIFFHLIRDIDDILVRFGLQHAHSLTTPIDKHT